MKTVKLNFPIEHQGKKVESLSLRPTTVGDHLTVSKRGIKGEMEQEIHLLSIMTESDTGLITSLDYRDYQLVMKEAMDFLLLPESSD